MSPYEPVNEPAQRERQFWACCCCDDEWPSADQIPDSEDHCGDNAWVVKFTDSDAGRRRLDHYRETYRSDLLK